MKECSFFGWIIPLMHCETICTMTPYMEMELFLWLSTEFWSMKTNSMRSHDSPLTVRPQRWNPTLLESTEYTQIRSSKTGQTRTLWQSDDYVHISSSYRRRRANECQAMKIIINYIKRECSGLERGQELSAVALQEKILMAWLLIFRFRKEEVLRVGRNSLGLASGQSSFGHLVTVDRLMHVTKKC